MKGFAHMQESKKFFFEKKHQKTFAPLRAVLKQRRANVFCGAFFQKSDRLLAPLTLCVALLTLTGCVGAFNPFDRPGNWAEEGSANETIAQQAANPADLISGTSNPLSSGTVATHALDKVTVFTSTSTGSGSTSGSGSGGGGGGS